MTLDVQPEPLEANCGCSYWAIIGFAALSRFASDFGVRSSGAI